MYLAVKKYANIFLIMFVVFASMGGKVLECNSAIDFRSVLQQQMALLNKRNETFNKKLAAYKLDDGLRNSFHHFVRSYLDTLELLSVNRALPYKLVRDAVDTAVLVLEWCGVYEPGLALLSSELLDTAAEVDGVWKDVSLDLSKSETPQEDKILLISMNNHNKAVFLLRAIANKIKNLLDNRQLFGKNSYVMSSLLSDLLDESKQLTVDIESYMYRKDQHRLLSDGQKETDVDVAQNVLSSSDESSSDDIKAVYDCIAVTMGDIGYFLSWHLVKSMPFIINVARNHWIDHVLSYVGTAEELVYRTKNARILLDYVLQQAWVVMSKQTDAGDFSLNRKISVYTDNDFALETMFVMSVFVIAINLDIWLGFPE